MQELLQRKDNRPSATELAELGATWDSTFVHLGPTDAVLMHNE